MKFTQNSLHHSPIAIVILGGILGTSLNLITTFSLYLFFQWNPYVSFFCGTILNELFHHLYYHIVFINKEIRMRTKLPIQFSLYTLVALGSLVALWFFLNILILEFMIATIFTLLCISIINILFIRISNFSSAYLSDIEYAGIDPSYQEEIKDEEKVSKFRAWYHSSRYKRLEEFITIYYHPNTRIADLGCGSCLWNTKKIPITGVDINEKMLQWAYQNNRLSDYSVTDNLANTKLPDKSFDIVVMSETLEHIINLDEVLSEVLRILKDDGVFLITVPYDYFLGPFFLLFNINCLYMGFIKKNRYYQYRCGHINHFNKKRLREKLKKANFNLEKLFVVNFQLLYAAAKK